MDIIEKYQLSFIKDERQGFPKAESKVFQELGEALFDFRYSLSDIIENTIKYNTIVSNNPTNNNQRGMTSDEEHFRYWSELYEIDYYGSDLYSFNLYSDKVEVSQLGYECFEIPIDDWIEILQHWQNFLRVNYGKQFD